VRGISGFLQYFLFEFTVDFNSVLDFLELACEFLLGISENFLRSRSVLEMGIALLQDLRQLTMLSVRTIT
jgi:hypothetical protein